MKRSYRFILPTVLLSSVFSVAQTAAAPAATNAAPVEAATAKPVPAEAAPATVQPQTTANTAPATAPATQPAVNAAPATAPAQVNSAAATPAATAPAQPIDTTKAAAANPAPATDATVPATAPATAPAPDSAAVQPASVAATDSTLAPTQPADSATTAADSAQAVAAAPAADSTAAVDTTAATPAADSTLANAPAVDSTATTAAAVDTTAAKPAVDSVAVPVAEPIAEAVEQPPQGTELKGELHGILTADKSPYLVTGDISIAPNTALLIQPGVTLQFMPGTGLSVNNGQIMASGTTIAPIVFKAAMKGEGKTWKGIAITGEEQAILRNVDISGANAGIAIENGKLSLQSASIHGTTGRGLYVRNAAASVMDCEFTDNAGVAVHASNYADVSIERTKLIGNNVALLNSELAHTTVTETALLNNNYGIMAKQNNMFELHETSISDNKVGASSNDMLDETVLASVKGNDKDFDSDALTAMSTLPANPEIPGVESRPVNPDDKIGVLVREQEEQATVTDSSATTWNLIGNAMLGGNYHYVKTRKNHGSDVDINGKTVKHGDHYRNVFQVPGFGAEASAYLMLQSSDGKTIEFNMDLTSDSWNHFSPNPVTLKYTDQYSQLTLGDMQKTAGSIYMSNLPLFGVDYTLSLLKNNADEPLFALNGFFGEAKRSLVLGARHPEIYKNYIEDGTAQAQRLAYGGSFKWAPVRRFDATFGAIYASDEIDDPLFRDGASKTTATADPMVDAFTVYADGNWLFFPGDIELNGQIAVGRADTTDVLRQRAINKVFDNANLETTSYTTLRKLMQNQSSINYMSHEELVEIFGATTGLRDQEMRDSLRTLVKEAKKIQKSEESDRDDDRVMGLDWGSQNLAIGASLNWNIYKTRLSGHIKYVGEDFYSAGSENQLANTREFGGRLEQDIFSFWTFGFDYQINVENASKGAKKNLIGLGEGTHFGLFPDKNSSWFDEHELDRDRTKYIQKIGTDQTFNITKDIELVIGYSLLFQKQYRQYQLHGDYILEDNIYRDDWFKPIKGEDTDIVVVNGDSTRVNAKRWERYNSLITEEYLASKFQERIFKHTWNAGITVKALQSVFKVNGKWTLRTDDSKFYKDELISDMDLADTTWAKLGYYFHGGDYFEQTYPVAVTTTLKAMQNRFEVTPRIKSYERDDMTETEVDVADELEIPFMNRFLILGVNGEFRYMVTDWEEASEDYDETETDVLGGISLRVNHTKHFYSEWNVGSAFYYRPDDLSSEYKDVFGGVRLNYVF